MNEESPYREKRSLFSLMAITPNLLAVEQIVVEAGRFGVATIRRVYGDWTTANMKSWKDILRTHMPFSPSSNSLHAGKNATDSAMIIDAMDVAQRAGGCVLSGGRRR